MISRVPHPYRSELREPEMPCTDKELAEWAAKAIKAAQTLPWHWRLWLFLETAPCIHWEKPEPAEKSK